MAIIVTDEMMTSWPSEAQAAVWLLLAHNARLEALRRRTTR